MKYAPAFLVVTVILLFCCCRHITDKRYEIQVYQTAGSGYGYALYRYSTKIIDQPHIPAVQHFQPFATEEEARRVAGLVKKKLEANISLPTVTLQELDSLRIDYH